jgi:hypothetical protein
MLTILSLLNGHAVAFFCLWLPLARVSVLVAAEPWMQDASGLLPTSFPHFFVSPCSSSSGRSQHAAQIALMQCKHGHVHSGSVNYNM